MNQEEIYESTLYPQYNSRRLSGTVRCNYEESIANISRLADEAKNIFEAEMKRVDKTVSRDAGGTQVREVQIVHVRNEACKPYLESDTDVDEFIENLSGKLKKAIKDGKRIRVE